MPKNYFSVTLFLLWLDFALCSVYYITPSSSDPCPTTPCVTLPQITLDNLQSNTTLVFLPGDHDLNSTLHISNIGMLVMLSSVDESVPVIHCGQGSNLTILNISDVHIVGLEFRCGGNRIVNVNQFVVENSIFYGQNSSSGTILEIVATCAYVMNSIFKFGTVGNLREYLDVLDYLQETFFGTILLSVRVGGAVIVTNSNVTIRHSHFEGNSAQIGGALFSEMNSNITVDSCTFLNNNASGCNDDRCLGGAVFVDTGCTVVIENSSVESNMALTGGGAFSTFQAMLSIRDCVIYSNIANYGGAIAVYLNSTLMIEDSQFYNNVAEFLGGVVNVVGSLSFIDSSTLYNNTAGTDGGVLASQQGSTINIENCTFVNNFVGVSGGVMVVQYDSEINICNSLCTQNVAAFKGGVAYAQHMSSFSSENCTFVANRASNDGGVVQVEDRSNASLYNSTFSKNRVGTFGGVIHVERDSALVADSCEFYENSAVEDGGVIDIYTSGVITIYNSFFAYNIGEDDAGVINSFGMVVLSIYNSTFINNSATDDGGVIYVRQANSVTIDDSTFIGNSAHQGGVATVTAMFQNITTTLTNCTLSHNTANFGGVIATLASGMVVIDHSIFNYNSGYSQGGVVYAFQSGRIFIDDSTFVSNTAGTGGVVAVFRNIFVQVITSTFISNNASNDGGAIYAFSDSTVIIDYCTFGDNTADDGGVLYARQSSSVAINRSNMTYNKATFGGVMRVRENSGIVIDDSRFLNNMAISEGGVGNAYRNSTITVNGSIFEGNKGDYGGTLVAFQSSSLTFCRCSFVNNSANFGGVARIYRSSTFNISSSNFTFNRAQDTGGIAFLQQGSNFNIDNSHLDMNEAEFGGVVYTEQGSSVFINNSQFMNNTAEDNGGVINAHVDSIITINNGIFNHNMGGLNGGVIHLSESSTANIGSSTFGYNSARRDGGVVYGIESCYIAIENSSFISNSVNDDGGVVYVQTGCFILLTRCGFDLNTARDNGGVIFMMEGSTMSIFDSDISLSEAGDNGGVIYGETNCTINIDVSVFSNNTADRHGGVTCIEDRSIISINNSVFSYNRAARKGGVISALLRNTINVSNTSFSCNMAGEKGGAVAVDNSSVTVYGKHNPRFTPQSMIKNNSAAEGGGVYLLNSQFYFKGDTNVADNQATEQGGGIHGVNSSVIVERDVHFVNNKAEYGGGISLERNGKLYGLSTSDNNSTTPLLTFTANRAKYGGALHVADETNPVLCSTISSSTNSECFIQPFLNSDARLMFFSDNSAEKSGSNLFGGLLDRCIIRDLASGGASFTNGATSFKKLSGITELETIASNPVRICFCKNEELDCSYDPSFIKVKRGESIDISVVAVDHVNHTVNDSTIYASLNSTVGSLGEGQETQRTHTGCTDLSYDLLSPHDSERLLLHAEGPCSNRGISQLSTLIQILPCTCSIGFVRSKRDKTRCLCDCDPKLSGYITECDPSEGSVLRKGNFWIMYVNTTVSGGYLIYPNCPLDYCHPPNEAVVINLNVPNGADVQCVSNRSGLLCGTCQPGFSLSIGSSHCIKCLNNWPVVLAMILVSSIIAGIALVIFLLVLNLTVAVGTLNAIIFYANIVGANSSAFFLSSEITFASVFISWLNLDIGIDSCFFKGMDAYSKTWLQLAFPAYIIFIITMVIFFSSCSSKFANLIGKRNPVATLATLLLLSYSKLLQTIISAFSFATLVNPSDLTSIRVWLPDATVLYLNGKHIPLFVVALVIFLIGLAYTFLLFTWQLFLRSPRARIFNWTRSPKLSFFMDTYHAPYTPRHRYWTGLLLIARAILFLISAINFSGDPRVTLLSTIIIVSLLFFYKALFNVRIYKNWLISAMETLVYLNIVIFATFTWYTFDTNRNQSAVAHTSVGIVFIMLVFVIAYHVYRYLNIQPFIKLRQSVLCQKLSKKLHSSAEKNQEALADKNTQELFDAIDRDPQDKATHTFLDILESQNRGHQETSSSIPDLSSGTEVTISKSKGSSEVSTFNPIIETNNLLTPLLDNGESTV